MIVTDISSLRRQNHSVYLKKRSIIPSRDSFQVKTSWRWRLWGNFQNCFGVRRTISFINVLTEEFSTTQFLASFSTGCSCSGGWIPRCRSSYHRLSLSLWIWRWSHQGVISNYYGLIVKIKICILPKRRFSFEKFIAALFRKIRFFLHSIAIIPTQLKSPLIEVVPRVGFLETAAIFSRGDWLWKVENDKDENKGAIVDVRSFLTVHSY